MISMQAAANNYMGQSGHGEQSASQSTASCVPWLGGIGSHAFQQPASLCNPIKLLSVDDSGRVPGNVKQMGLLLQQQSSSTKGAGQSQSESEGGQLGTTTKQSLPIQSGFDQSNMHEQHQQSMVTVIPSSAVDYLMPQTQLELGHSVAHVAYPYTDPCFHGIVATFGVQSMIHPHLVGGQQARIALPLEMTEEEPVYVNAKQYHGILRRRQSRAKAELENKLVKVRKPYLHESRHRHAMRRLRGCGGRFLNTKKLNESKLNNGTDNGNGSKGQAIHAGSSSGSEVLQSESGNIIFLQEVQCISAISGSEVTSMAQSYTNANNLLCSDNNGVYINPYQHQHFHLSAFHPLSGGCDGVDTGQGGVMLSNGLQQRAVAI